MAPGSATTGRRDTSRGSTSSNPPRATLSSVTVPGLPVYQELALRDNGDTDIDTRWTDDAGTPYALTSASGMVRVTEASGSVLVTASVILLGAPDHWARLTFRASDIAAATFEALDPDEPAWWDCLLIRSVDSKPLVPLAGRVSWNKGVTR